MSELEVGSVVGGKYRLLRRLGEGGQGEVFEAEHVELGLRVAIKVLLADRASADDAARFEREGRAIARLRSPHVVRVQDVGTLPSGARYLVMDRLEGHNLSARIATGPVTTSDLVTWMLHVASALKEAHAAGIVHRDLKPSNIFISPAGVASVLDFGISKDATAGTLTDTGITVGTPRYMAPEQIRSSRAVDGKADVYSLGVILYRTLGGRYPYDADNVADLAMEHATRPPADLTVLRPELPASLAAAVMRAIAADPATRCSLDELVAMLTPLSSREGRVVLGPLEHATTMSSPQDGASRTRTRTRTAAPPKSRTRLWLLSAAAPLAVGGVGLAAIGIWSRTHEKATEPKDASATEDARVEDARMTTAPDAEATTAVVDASAPSSDGGGHAPAANGVAAELQGCTKRPEPTNSMPESADPKRCAEIFNRAKAAIQSCVSTMPVGAQGSCIVHVNVLVAADGTVERAVGITSPGGNCALTASGHCIESKLTPLRFSKGDPLSLAFPCWKR